MVQFLLPVLYTGLETLTRNKNMIPLYPGELGTQLEYNMETNLEIDKMLVNTGDLKD
jgi:hypothetical protein